MDLVSTSCPNCGTANAATAKFCSSCGHALGGPEPARDTRRTVTVLFVDVAGSTALGERLDPEAVRAVMGAYFDLARAVVERHGGMVEKFIGDAVMAVFGLPSLHEDDALRAVRAGVELRARLGDGSGGHTLMTRMGINTGTVAAGDPAAGQRLVTGDAVNVAARLEQHAAAGEILLGEETYRLVRSAVSVEGVRDFEAKGKSERVRAYPLLTVDGTGEIAPRHLDSPLVGRQRELERLRRSFEDAVSGERAILFTLLGSAGVGKSRLVHEFVGSVRGGATIVTGRCLPYGEGITYWPIAEIAREAAGIAEDDDQGAALAKLSAVVAAEPDGAEIAARIATAIGLVVGDTNREDLFRAVRRLLEALARARPVVAVFDDLHWAEATLLDAIEHVVDWSRGRPILVIAVARPDLLDNRTDWGGGKLDAQTALLEPLAAPDTTALAEAILGGRVDPELLRRIEAVAEGNPLFVEQLVAMLVEDGVVVRTVDGWQAAAAIETIAVPPTVSALIAARLDRLPVDERRVTQRASVVGRVFERASIVELSPEPDRASVPDQLRRLVRRELIRPDDAPSTAEDSFRFRHILIRDAAYEALPKRERFDLHERFADWLETTAGARLAEFEEIVGYHLEQAIRYRVDLGLDEPDAAELRHRAATHLAAAAERAIDRGDVMGGVRLWTRSMAIRGASDPAPVRDLLALAAANVDLRAAPEVLSLATQAEQRARETGDVVGEARARIYAALGRLNADPSYTTTDLDAVVEAVLPDLEQVGDERGLAEAWSARGMSALTRSRWTEASEAYERVHAHATAAGARALQDMSGFWISNTLLWGRTPADEGLARIRQLEATTSSRLAKGLHMIAASALLGYLDRPEEAWATADAGRALLRELGVVRTSNLAIAQIARSTGDWARAVELLEAGRENMEALGETGTRSTVEGMLALSFANLARYVDAVAVSEASERNAAADDAASQVLWRAARAVAFSHLGRADDALELASTAVAIAAATDQDNVHAEALEAQWEVLEAAGRHEEARAVFESALTDYRSKGNLASLRRLAVSADHA